MNNMDKPEGYIKLLRVLDEDNGDLIGVNRDRFMQAIAMIDEMVMTLEGARDIANRIEEYHIADYVELALNSYKEWK